MQCGNCGSTISEATNFCPYCGMSLQLRPSAADANQGSELPAYPPSSDPSVQAKRQVSTSPAIEPRRKPKVIVIVAVIVAVLAIVLIGRYAYAQYQQARLEQELGATLDLIHDYSGPGAASQEGASPSQQSGAYGFDEMSLVSRVNIRLRIPSGWESTYNASSRLDNVLYSCDADSRISFGLEFWLASEEDKEKDDATVEEIDTHYWADVQSSRGFVKQLSRDEVDVNGMPAIEYVYLVEEDDVTYRCRTCYLITTERIVDATARCPESIADEVWDGLDAIMASIQEK